MKHTINAVKKTIKLLVNKYKSYDEGGGYAFDTLRFMYIWKKDKMEAINECADKAWEFFIKKFGKVEYDDFWIMISAIMCVYLMYVADAVLQDIQKQGWKLPDDDKLEEMIEHYLN